MTAPPASTTPRAPWWCSVGIIAATLAAYHNSLHGPFVFDDASSIVTNPTIQKLSSLGEVLAGPVTNVTAQGRPLLNLSLALNYAIGGTAVEGYHVGNLIIHTLAALALFGILRRTLRREHATPLAFAIAVLWAVHPLQSESVTYTIQRAESLVGLFYLLTLYCFARAAECNVLRYTPTQVTAWYAAAIAASLLGMATKEVMATAPLMVLFFDRTFYSGTFLGALRQRRGFYAALASTWLLLAWLVLQTGGNRGGSVGFGVGVAWWEYGLTQFNAIVRYLWLSLWPHPLVFEYGAFWIRGLDEVALHALVVLGLLGATIVALWRRSALGFAGAWFFGILAPTSLAPGTTQMIVEHRMYLPLAAVLAVGVVGLAQCSRKWQIGFLGAVALGLALLTIARNADYRSDLVLWADTIAKRPENPLAHFMLAGAQERAGQLSAARASYERTLRLKPDFSIGHEHFGEFLMRAGRHAEAIEHFAAALRLNPDYADAHANLGNAHLAAGRTAEAVEHLRKAAQLAPYTTTPEAHFNLANALMELGQIAEAIARYEAAIHARPSYSSAHYNLGNALAASGRPADAVPHYEAALRARPDYPEAHHNLASALFETGRLPEAARHYEETLRLAPDFPNARANLDRVRAQMARQ